MSIIVLLSLNHFFPHFPFFELSFINLKPLHYQREIIITPLFQKTNKSINGISDRLEMCKNISANILIYQPIWNFIPCCTRSIPQVLP